MQYAQARFIGVEQKAKSPREDREKVREQFVTSAEVAEELLCQLMEVSTRDQSFEAKLSP